MGGAAAPRPSTRTTCAGHRDVGQPRAMRASSGPPGLQQGSCGLNPRYARTKWAKLGTGFTQKNGHGLETWSRKAAIADRTQADSPEAGRQMLG